MLPNFLLHMDDKHCETWFVPGTYPSTSGVKRLNSLIQLGKVERGATTRKGPMTFFSIIMAMWAMHWMVFPSPISSARIPLMPFSQSIWQHRGSKTGCQLINNSKAVTNIQILKHPNELFSLAVNLLASFTVSCAKICIPFIMYVHNTMGCTPLLT